MGVTVRQKGGKWYVFINHQGQRKAKCIGSDKRVTVQVQKQLEAKLALGDVGLLKEEPQTVQFREYAVFFTLVRTGMREGEALGLRWMISNLGDRPMIHTVFCMSSVRMIRCIIA